MNTDADFHAVMSLLQAMQMEHGLCEPRSRRACTHCNAKDDLDALVKAYKGHPVVLAAQPSAPPVSEVPQAWRESVLGALISAQRGADLKECMALVFGQQRAAPVSVDARLEELLFAVKQESHRQGGTQMLHGNWKGAGPSDCAKRECAALRAYVNTLRHPKPGADKAAAPIDMVLFCPECRHQHVDAPEPDSGWINPPHKSHLCHKCGTVWRPADIATNGVASTKTRGSADSILFAPTEPQVSASDGVVVPLPPPDYQESLRRFAETAEDDESYDIGVDAVEQLAAYGLLRRRGTTTIYEITTLGQQVLVALARARK